MVIPFKGWTNKFIFPPYDFQVANCMISNFHLPKSTLLMHVASFGGYELVMKAYTKKLLRKNTDSILLERNVNITLT